MKKAPGEAPEHLRKGATSMNETLKILKERRSIRSFRPEPVREEDLNAILEAGIYAPSAKNLQSTKLVVVQDRETLALLERVNAELFGDADGHPFYGAPMAVVVLSDSTYPCWLQDGALVIGNLMNAAAALGVGSCWINRAIETFERPEGKALLKKWGLGETWKGVGNCILGYTDAPVLGDKPRKEGRILRV
jgi:nitroreductase